MGLLIRLQETHLQIPPQRPLLRHANPYSRLERDQTRLVREDLGLWTRDTKLTGRTGTLSAKQLAQILGVSTRQIRRSRRASTSGAAPEMSLGWEGVDYLMVKIFMRTFSLLSAAEQHNPALTRCLP